MSAPCGTPTSARTARGARATSNFPNSAAWPLFPEGTYAVPGAVLPAAFTSGSFPLVGAEDTSGTNRFFKLEIE